VSDPTPPVAEPSWSTALTLWLVLGILLAVVSQSWVPIPGSAVLGAVAIHYERWQNGRHKRR
jgi:hypothetical protein